MNAILGNVLKLIKNNVGTSDAPWMNRIASMLCTFNLLCRYSQTLTFGSFSHFEGYGCKDTLQNIFLFITETYMESYTS